MVSSKHSAMVKEKTRPCQYLVLVIAGFAQCPQPPRPFSHIEIHVVYLLVTTLLERHIKHTSCKDRLSGV